MFIHRGDEDEGHLGKLGDAGKREGNWGIDLKYLDTAK
jgi:hypothetical protein